MADADLSLSSLLRQWGLAQAHINKFEDQEITLYALHTLTEANIVELLPKLGPQNTFRSKLKEYLSAQNALTGALSESGSMSNPPTSDHNTPASTSTSEPSTSSATSDVSPRSETTSNKRKSTVPSSDELPAKLSLLESEPSVNAVHSILKAHPEGKIILSHYNKFRKLNDRRRDELCTRVIYNELMPDLTIRLKNPTFDNLAQLICSMFPTEDPATWFLLEEVDSKTVVSGRLKHKFYNLRRKFIKVGLISSARLRSELESDEGIDIDNDIDIENDEDILWLMVYEAPYVEVLSHWENSQDLRKCLLQTLDLSVYVSKFPFLKRSRGWELLVFECEKQYPEWKERVTTHWPKFIKYIASKLKTDTDDNDTEATLTSLTSAATLFKPRTVPKSPKVAKSSKCWKPSRAEAQASFFLHVKEAAKIQECIKARQESLLKYRYELQPFVVAIGPIEAIKQYLIVLDQHKWEAHSALQAVDICFKIFFALNGKYPIESHHIWLMIQRAVYECNLRKDFEQKGLKSYMAEHFKDFSGFDA